MKSAATVIGQTTSELHKRELTNLMSLELKLSRVDTTVWLLLNKVEMKKKADLIWLE